MDQFMWEKKLNNIIMKPHHRNYTDEGLQYDSHSQNAFVLNSTQAIVYHTLVA